MKKGLAETIKRLRTSFGMTQKELAEKLGITAQAVSKWEAGKTCPDVMTLPVLASLFGVTTDELLGCGEKTI